jgi:hypothetical protein
LGRLLEQVGQDPKELQPPGEPDALLTRPHHKARGRLGGLQVDLDPHAAMMAGWSARDIRQMPYPVRGQTGIRQTRLVETALAHAEARGFWMWMPRAGIVVLVHSPGDSRPSAERSSAGIGGCLRSRLPVGQGGPVAFAHWPDASPT